MDTFVTVVGNLTDDPELRFTPNGMAVANFRLAVTPRIQEGDTWKDGDTSFFRVNAWRAGCQRHRVTGQGPPRRDDRPAGNALLGDPGRRQAVGGGDRRQRGRPEPEAGHRQAAGSSRGRGRRNCLILT